MIAEEWVAVLEWVGSKRKGGEKKRKESKPPTIILVFVEWVCRSKASSRPTSFSSLIEDTHTQSSSYTLTRSEHGAIILTKHLQRIHTRRVEIGKSSLSWKFEVLRRLCSWKRCFEGVSHLSSSTCVCVFGCTTAEKLCVLVKIYSSLCLEHVFKLS